MNTAPLLPADAYTMPRPARHVHLYLVAVDGVIVAPVANRRPAACMRTETSALPLEYSNTHAYDKGLLLKETLFDNSGNPYVATVNKYEFWRLGDSLGSTVEPLNLDRYTERASATLFPRLTRTDKSFYEGKSEAGQSSYTEHGYDALGNVTDFAEGGSAVDPVSAHISYTSCTGSYIVGKPKLITVNAGGQEMRRRRKGDATL